LKVPDTFNDTSKRRIVAPPSGHSLEGAHLKVPDTFDRPQNPVDPAD
jgi:hypothetical protein